MDFCLLATVLPANHKPRLKILLTNIDFKQTFLNNPGPMSHCHEYIGQMTMPYYCYCNCNFSKIRRAETDNPVPEKKKQSLYWNGAVMFQPVPRNTWCAHKWSALSSVSLVLGRTRTAVRRVFVMMTPVRYCGPLIANSDILLLKSFPYYGLQWIPRTNDQ